MSSHKTKTKLTLTINQSIVEKAKRYAFNENRSLSELIEHYLKALVSSNNEDEKTNQLSPTFKSLKGSFKLPVDFDYKKELTNRLSEKYLN